jgi:glucose-1-phosphate thymidylyltransferase
MRKADPGVALDSAQHAAADLGNKAMMPVGRPFLDYVLSGLADVGMPSVCLVVAPDHARIRAYYEGAGLPTRLSLSFAVQDRPLGTADAVLAAETFAAGESVVVLNADNLYPKTALRELAALRPRVPASCAAGLIGFRQATLLAGGNIPPERIRAFALIAVRADGILERIVEKPDERESRSFGANPLVSMNAWLLSPAIYPACRAIVPSARGELEIQAAVRFAMERLGEEFQVIESAEPVLDLSTREDIPAVTTRLAAVEVRL